MAHPLSGANIKTLTDVVRLSGLPEKTFAGLGIAASCLGRWPFSLTEKLVMEGRLPQKDELESPIFILGHWRSGTTHLYNVMTKSEAFGYVPPVATGLPWDMFGIGQVFRPLFERALPKHRYIDQIPVKPDSPQEDEIAIANMSDLSFYHGIYFPRAFDQHLRRGLFFDGCAPREVAAWQETFVYLLRKLAKFHDHKPLLIKNPVYTGRLAMLREMFPTAKFIHIHRNPYDVFLSMRNFYQKLFKQLSLQSYDHVDIDETILDTYDRMMRALERDMAEVPADRIVELRYDALDQHPLDSLELIYRSLAIPGYVAAKPKFEAYLASVKSFEKNRFDYADEAAQKVENRLSYFLEKWDYQRPGADPKPRVETADSDVT